MIYAPALIAISVDLNPFRLESLRAIKDLVSRSKTDLIDNNDSYELHVDVPGIPKEKLSINVTDGGIEINSKAVTVKEEDRKKYLFRERQY